MVSHVEKRTDKRIFKWLRNCGELCNSKHGRNAFVIAIFLCLFQPNVCLGHEPIPPDINNKKYRVLYINSYHHGYIWSDQIYTGIRKVMADNFGKQLDLEVEYLDGKRFAADLNGKLGEQIISIWATKYPKDYFNLLLISDQEAYNLVSRAREKIFPGVPMVFSGVENPEKTDKLTTGIITSTDIRENIEMIIQTIPKTRRIWIISDDSTTGKISRQQRMELSEKFKTRVKFEFLDEEKSLTPDELLKKIPQIITPDVIFFYNYSLTPAGPVNTLEFIQKLTETATVPVFSHIDLFLDYGITGGKMNSGKRQGQQMAEIGVAILKGKPIDQIKPPLEISQPNFNYLKLNQYDIPLYRLPTNSLIINQPDEFIHKYGWYLLFCIIFILGESYLLVRMLFLIQQHKQLRQESKEAAERFKSLFEMAPIPMTYSSLSGKIIDLNHQFTKILGYDINDIPSIEQWWHQAYPDPEYRQQVINSWAKEITGIINKGGNIKTAEYHITCKDRTVRTMELVASVIGENLIVCLFDLSERIQTETELKRANALLSAQQETSIDGILLVDEQGRILSSNRRFSEIWKIPEAIISTHSDDLVLPLAVEKTANPEEFRQKVKFLYENKELKSRDEVLLKDGRTLDRYSAPMIAADGTYYGRIWFFRDITDRKHTEAEREKLQSQLIQSQKMESVGRLAGGVAHDFNNMLGVIIGYTDMCMKGVDPALPLYLKLLEIKKAAQRSADLTRQLLAFARKQTVNPKILDLNETVTSMLKMLQRLIGEDIDLAWIPGQEAMTVKIDPSQLDQILANLCVNARDAIEGVGKIIIKTEKINIDVASYPDHIELIPGQYVIMTISDNGCGMDHETKEHLFEPFFTTKQLGHGTGLGLATVYGIVKQNNGYIYADSEQDKGTSFKIFLPFHSDILPEHPNHEPVKLSSGGQETILLVEDEPMLLELSKDILEELGYQILPAGSPAEALQLAENNQGIIDLLVTDVVMPEMNGKQLATRLSEKYPNMKILFMSGYTANVIIPQGILDAESNFLQKPFISNDLSSKVREILDEK